MKPMRLKLTDLTTKNLLLKLKSLAFCTVLYTSALAAAAEPTQQSLDIGHATLNAWVWDAIGGSGETIIALPGSGGDVSRYKYIGPLLAAAGYNVIAVNQRGIMGSTGNLSGLTLHDYAADIAAVIDNLGIGKAHLVGWALGNRTSRLVATTYPDKVASVSLIAAGGLARPLTEPGELGELLGNENLDFADKARLARRTLFSPDSDAGLVAEYVQELNYWHEARASQSEANRNTPLAQWWAGGEGPMLIVQGLDDKTAPPENGLRMQQEFGERISLVNLEHAGHMMGMERPQATAGAIIAFLQKHPI